MGSEVRSRALVLAVATACLLTATAPRARAQSLSDRETARSLMEDGDAKRDKGDWKGALKSYEAADAIMHVPTTGLEVGRAQAMQGLLLEARETLNRVERLPTKPNEPPPFAAARTSAGELSAELATRIPTILVTVKNAEPGQAREIYIDSDRIPPAASEAPRKVNPGYHTVLVKAAGLEKQEKVIVAEREQKIVLIDLRPQPATPVADTKPHDEATGSTQGSALPKVLIFGGFGLAVIGIGVGSVTGLMSMSKVDDIKPTCNPKCPQTQSGEIDSATTLGNVSTVAFIVGGAGVAAGVIGLVLSGKQHSTTAARVTPSVGPTWAGVTGTF